MLVCLMNTTQEVVLNNLEEVCDYVVNVLSDMEMGEDKMRLLFTDSYYMKSDGVSEEYLRKYSAQSNMEQSFRQFIDVDIV